MVITIAFGEIVRILVLNAADITGGPYGTKGICSFDTAALFHVSCIYDIWRESVKQFLYRIGIQGN